MVLPERVNITERGKCLMAETTSMTTLLTTLAEIVTKILGWVGSVAETIVSTPILLLTTGFLVLGGAIGIFGRMLSKN